MRQRLNRYLGLISFLSFLIATAIASPAFAQQAPSRRPNVLLIMADDLNDDMGTFGHKIVKTPNLDRLAARGVRFERAYTQFPLCSPSRVSLLTGLRPDTTKIYELQTNFRTILPDAVTLPQMFKRNGYVAARVGKIYHYGNPGDIGTSGLDDPASWDLVVNPRGVDKDEETKLTNLTPARGLGSALAYYASPASDDEHTDGKVASEVIALLEKNKDRPFFIGAGFYRPHCPFIAPKKYFDMYPLDRIAAPKWSPADVQKVPVPAWFTMPPNWNVSEDGVRATIQAYYASISFLDANVGRVLDALDRLGLAQNTVVVFISDHGYLLGERGQWMKQMLFERSARAPLIRRGRGCRREGASLTAHGRIRRPLSDPRGSDGSEAAIGLARALADPAPEGSARGLESSGRHPGQARESGKRLLHGLFGPHRTVALHGMGRRQAGHRALRRSGGSGRTAQCR